jgi:hypothetical protein
MASALSYALKPEPQGPVLGAWLTLLSFTFSTFCLLDFRFFQAWLGSHNWKPP